MALSPFPLNPSTASSSSSSSHSLYFVLLHSQPHRSKFTICSFDRSVQVDTHKKPQRIKVASEITKKNRKPKPSFFEEIRDKWSMKIASPREKFPWQEQREQGTDDGGDAEEEEEEEEEEVRSQKPTKDYVSEKKTDGKALESDPVRFGSQRRLVSAPWSHGTKTQDRSFNGFEEHCDNRVTNSVEEEAKSSEQVDRNSVFQREFDTESDSVSNGNRKEKEKTVSMYGNGVSFSNKPCQDEKDALNLVDYHFDSSLSDGFPSKRRAKSDSGEGEKESWRRRSNTDLAEEMVPEHELQRLRNVSLRMLERIKVGIKGITRELVETIHEKWKLDEVVKLKFEEPHSLNMKRTHDLLEVS